MPRKKYTGPCTICNKFSTGRYFTKMCKSCYQRMKTTGNTIPKIKYLGPCIECGSFDPKCKQGFVKKQCHSCYKKTIYRIENPLESKPCIDCGIAIVPDKRNIFRDRCPNCYRSWKWKNDPEYQSRAKKRRKRYSQTEKGKLSDLIHRTRRRSLYTENTLTKAQWKEILEHFDYCCAYCKKKVKLEMDHVFPLSKGGTHTADNVVPACRACNASKYNKILDSDVFDKMI